MEGRLFIALLWDLFKKKKFNVHFKMAIYSATHL